MQVIEGLETIHPPLERCVLTVGNFDGMHRAHQQLLAQAGLFAANTGGPVVVLTFEPHPLTVVAPDRVPQCLTPRDEKLRLLAECGAAITVVARSEPALLGLEAERFVEEIIVGKFRPTHVVEGSSFGFGRGRRGSPELLVRLGESFEFHTHIVDPVTLQIEPDRTVMVSSSLVRRLLLEGKVGRAALCLGRPYTLYGTVVQGRRRGRRLGFPTANLAVKGQLIPADGVYSGAALVDERSHPCALSIGVTPTFGGGERQVEAHLLDFDGDLQGRRVGVAIYEWIRGQQSFSSPDQLAKQIRQDVAFVRAHQAS